MLALLIKIIAGLFFVYISIDSFYKITLIQKEIDDEMINPMTGKILKSRALRSGIMFALAAILSFVSIMFRVAPLGE